MSSRTAQTDQAFSYDDPSAQLHSPADHFRLLHLEPSADPDAPFICSITCHPIHSPPPFAALSYAWESKDRTHKALIGRKWLGITESVNDALRQLREPDSVLTLWIDQICINQGDDKEKTAQVKAMEIIYTFASPVLVWLGKEENDSEAVMRVWHDVGLWTKELDLIGNLPWLRPIDRDEVLAPGDRMLIFRSLIMDYALPKFRPLLSAMVQWFQRSWFQRVWVLQEFALPRATPVFVCGKDRVDADLVYPALAIYKLSGSQLSKDEPSGSPSKAHIQKMEKAMHTENISMFTTVRTQRQARSAGLPGDDLLDILRKMYVEREMKATDDRDRVFAVLSLAADATDSFGIVPNYTVKGCEAIYTKVARALIRDTKRLDVLSWAQPTASPNPNGLPTWVPDWRCKLAPSYHPLIIPRLRVNALFSPSLSSLPRFLDTLDDKVLCLKGIAICAVEKVGAPWDDEQGHAARVRLLTTVEGFCRESAVTCNGNDNIYSSPSRREQAVWRVPIGDLYLTSSGFMAEMGDLEDGRFVAEWGPECDGTPYLISVDYMRGKRPFLGKGGYVGMGPKLMEPGDVVVVFAGAHLPHVVRKTKNQDRYWEYVGEAYCDGVMDGEAWDEEKLEPFLLV